MRLSIFRTAHFNAAHRLHVEHWSNEKNETVFGLCNNPHYHGHNYELIVKVVGVPDAATGYVIDTKILSNIIQQEVIEKFDHKNLNLDTVEFKQLNPTAENIAMVIYNLLRPHIAMDKELIITLYETEKNFVQYPA